MGKFVLERYVCCPHCQELKYLNVRPAWEWRMAPLDQRAFIFHNTDVVEYACEVCRTIDFTEESYMGMRLCYIHRLVAKEYGCFRVDEVAHLAGCTIPPWRDTNDSEPDCTNSQ